MRWWCVAGRGGHDAMSLRLAINATCLAPGGGLTGLLGYLKAWRQIDAPLEITLFASRPEVMDAARACREDIRIEPVAVGASRRGRFTFQLRRLGRHIRRAGADVVMTTNCLVGRCPLPQVVHFRNLWNFTYPSLPASWRARGLAFMMRDWAGRRALRKSRCNAFISDYLRRAAEAVVPGSAPRNHVVHNGLDRDVVETAGRRPSLWDGAPVLAAVQGDSDQKDNATLIRTMAELVSRRGDVDWRLRIAGGGDWTRYWRLAEELGVRDRIEWLGYRDGEALDRLLRESLCLVFTSVLEGFGNPPLEAMARKCPVVAVDATAVPEVVDDAGLLVPPRDPGAFAEAVVRLRDEPGLRDEMVDRGLERIRRFVWTDSAVKMLDLFRSVVEDAAPVGAGADGSAWQPAAGREMT